MTFKILPLFLFLGSALFACSFNIKHINKRLSNQNADFVFRMSDSNGSTKIIRKIPVVLANLFLSNVINTALPNFVHADTEEAKVAPWNAGIKYTVVKSGDGDMPKRGDLVAVRFIGSYNGKCIYILLFIFDLSKHKQAEYYCVHYLLI